MKKRTHIEQLEVDWWHLQHNQVIGTLKKHICKTTKYVAYYHKTPQVERFLLVSNKKKGRS